MELERNPGAGLIIDPGKWLNPAKTMTSLLTLPSVLALRKKF